MLGMAGFNWRLVRRFGWVFALVIAVGLAFEGWQLAKPHVNRPVSKIALGGDLSAYNESMLKENIFQHLQAGAGFVDLDIRELQAVLAGLPWVERVRIKRVWPDTLMVEVTEHKAIARWGEDQLLNVQAKAFPQLGMRNFADLPRLSGPEHSQVRVLEQYRSLSQVLRPLGLGIAELEMRERGSWFVTASNGLQLLLGREEVMEKMRRFITIYEKELKNQLVQIARVDLRYANGLAVTWRDAVTQTGQ